VNRTPPRHTSRFCPPAPQQAWGGKAQRIPPVYLCLVLETPLVFVDLSARFVSRMESHWRNRCQMTSSTSGLRFKAKCAALFHPTLAAPAPAGPISSVTARRSSPEGYARTRSPGSTASTARQLPTRPGLEGRIGESPTGLCLSSSRLARWFAERATAETCKISRS